MKLRALAPGKTNLGLFLGPTRPDGYHELVSLIEPLSLADELTLEPRPGAEQLAAPEPGLSGEACALGADEVVATKELLGFDPSKDFAVEKDVLARTREVKKRGKAAHKEWDKKLAAWRKANPERSALLDRLVEGKAPAGLDKALPTFETSDKGLATRAASGKVLTALADGPRRYSELASAVMVDVAAGGKAGVGESQQSRQCRHQKRK